MSTELRPEHHRSSVKRLTRDNSNLGEGSESKVRSTQPLDPQASPVATRHHRIAVDGQGRPMCESLCSERDRVVAGQSKVRGAGKTDCASDELLLGLKQPLGEPLRTRGAPGVDSPSGAMPATPVTHFVGSVWRGGRWRGEDAALPVGGGWSQPQCCCSCPKRDRHPATGQLRAVDPQGSC